MLEACDSHTAAISNCTREDFERPYMRSIRFDNRWCNGCSDGNSVKHHCELNAMRSTVQCMQNQAQSSSNKDSEYIRH